VNCSVIDTSEEEPEDELYLLPVFRRYSINNIPIKINKYNNIYLLMIILMINLIILMIKKSILSLELQNEIQ